MASTSACTARRRIWTLCSVVTARDGIADLSPGLDAGADRLSRQTLLAGRAARPVARSRATSMRRAADGAGGRDLRLDPAAAPCGGETSRFGSRPRSFTLLELLHAPARRGPLPDRALWSNGLGLGPTRTAPNVIAVSVRALRQKIDRHSGVRRSRRASAGYRLRTSSYPWTLPSPLPTTDIGPCASCPRRDHPDDCRLPSACARQGEAKVNRAG